MSPIRLIAPTGETFDAPDAATAQHYLSIGARRDFSTAPTDVPFPGGDDSIEANPLLDPTMIVPSGGLGTAARVGARIPRMGAGLARMAGITPRAAGRAAEAAPSVLARLGDAASEEALGKVPGAHFLRRLLSRGAPPGAAPAPALPPGATAVAGGPLSLGEQSAPAVTDEAMQATQNFMRRKGFAMMKEAGFPTEAEAQRKFLSDVLGREVKSRSDVTIAEWAQVQKHAEETIAQKAADEAAKRATARVTAKAEKAASGPYRPSRAAARATPKNPAEGRLRAVKPPRGASGPELARRSAARARAVGRPVSEAPELSPDLSMALGQSLDVASAARQAGLEPRELLFLLSQLRQP